MPAKNFSVFNRKILISKFLLIGRKMVYSWNQTFSSFTAFFLFLLYQFIHGDILRSTCVREGYFFLKEVDFKAKVKVPHSTWTADLQLCFDECLEHPDCKAINGFEKNSARFQCELLNSTTDVSFTSAKGWRYYDSGDDFILELGPHCRSLTYNPCYPCRCRDNCQISMFTCSCDRLSATLPEIYIPFEKGQNASRIYYIRGKRFNGLDYFGLQDAVLVQEKNRERDGMVIQTEGTAFVQIEYCRDCFLRYPDKFTMAFWVLHRYKNFGGLNTYLIQARPVHGDGIMLSHTGSQVQLTLTIHFPTKYYLATGKVIKEKLLKWTHIAFTFSKADKVIILYANGKEIGRGIKDKVRAYQNLHKVVNFPFRMGILQSKADVSDLIQMDDLVIWKRVLTPEEILYLYGIG